MLANARASGLRTLPLLLALAASAAACDARAQAAEYPSRPIRLVIGFAPGGAADYVARAMSDAFAKAIGQSVAVDNKPGNGSSIAADLVAKSPPDGYTLLIASPSSISVNPALNPALPYSATDLAPVTKMTTSPLVLAVNPATGIRSVPELIAAAKKDPGKLNYSTSGNGSAPHLGRRAVRPAHRREDDARPVPRRRSGDPVGDRRRHAADVRHLAVGAAAGRAPGACLRSPSARASARRSSPACPGMREAGLPDYHLEFWYGLFVPAATPPAIVRKIHDATVAAMQTPAVKVALEREGTEVSLSGSPEQFAKFLADDAKFWVNLVKSANVKTE